MSPPLPPPSSLQIRRFDGIPSPEEFASQIESRNVPTVFSGCISNWKAFSKWNPSNGGLEYLQEKVGSSIVESMLSRSAPVFNGDIRSHERVSLPFCAFIGYCKDIFQRKHGSEDRFLESTKHYSAESEDEQHGFPQQIYLAQVPISNVESTEKVQLETLREDIEMPPFLEKKTVSSINLWMNSAQTRSSTHYDPHHNLLCIVTGCKQVILWPPSASPFLYPLPIYGEASNHSAVPLEKSNYHAFPRAEYSEEYSQKVILHAGDALFLPEGWYHQIDSECLTTAVNFWWRSNTMSSLLEHMDSYYLRRILRRLIDTEMDQMLYMPSDANGHGACNNGTAERTDQHLDCDSEKKCLEEKDLNPNLKERFALHELDPYVIKSLHELVALVHERVNPSQEVNCTSVSNLVTEEKIMKEELFHLKDDPIANILWCLQPHGLKLVFLAMAHNFPRTLEALILHALSPVGAEVLTRKFEEMDRLIGEEYRNQFYQMFYSVFDDQFAAMDVLLNGKESFSRQTITSGCNLVALALHNYQRQDRILPSGLAFASSGPFATAYKNVLDKYLGIDFGGQNLW